MCKNQQESYTSILGVQREKKLKNHVKSSQIIFDGIKCIFCAVCISVVFFFLVVLWCASFRTNIWMCALSKLSHLFRSPYFSIPLPINVAHKGNVTRTRSLPILVCLAYTQKHHCTTDRMTWHFYLHLTVSGGCCTIRNAKVHFPLLHLFSIFYAVEFLLPVFVALPECNLWVQRQTVTTTKRLFRKKKVQNKEITIVTHLASNWIETVIRIFFFYSTARRIKLVEYFRVNIRNWTFVSLSFSLVLWFYVFLPLWISHKNIALGRSLWRLKCVKQYHRNSSNGRVDSTKR